MALDAPDPMDLLLAHSKDAGAGPRPLDFVREKLRDLRGENTRLRERVTDLEQTLSIVQTAQEWSVGKGMTQEQVDKMNEIRGLLEQARKAKEEIATFSNSSRQNLYEKLRSCKLALRKEREEGKQMKHRLAHAFEHMKEMKEQMRRLEIQRETEREQLQQVIRRMQEKHIKDMRRLAADPTAQVSVDREQVTQFNEAAIEDLLTLQKTMQDVKQVTVDEVDLAGDSAFMSQDQHSGSVHLQASTDSDDLAGAAP
jgi:chromosome segregation ATPase